MNDINSKIYEDTLCEILKKYNIIIETPTYTIGSLNEYIYILSQEIVENGFVEDSKNDYGKDIEEALSYFIHQKMMIKKCIELL